MNVVGSSKVSPEPPKGYGSWKGYWINKSNHTLSLFIDPNMEWQCPLCGDTFKLIDMVGGHVQKMDSTDEKWYITLVCDPCNKTPGKEGNIDIDLDDLLPLLAN